MRCSRAPTRARSAALPAVDGPCLYFRARMPRQRSARSMRPPLGTRLRRGSRFLPARRQRGIPQRRSPATYSSATPATRRLAPPTPTISPVARELALGKLYPAYANQKAETAARDPARPFARRVDLLRLAEAPERPLLFISHPWGGGIRRHMNDLAALVGGRCEVLYLEPAVGDTVKLYWPRAGEGFAAYFTLPGELPELADVAAHDRCRAAAFSSRAPAAAGASSTSRPRSAFPTTARCTTISRSARNITWSPRTGTTAASRTRPDARHASRAARVSGASTSRRGAARSDSCCAVPSRVIAPSQRRRASGCGATFPISPSRSGRIRRSRRTRRHASRASSVLGNLSPEKGLHVVAACAREARALGCRSSFRVLGSTTEPVPQSPEVPLTIHGQYVDADLPRTDRRRKARRDLVPGAGAGNLLVHAVGCAGLGTAHRRVGARARSPSAWPVIRARPPCRGTHRRRLERGTAGRRGRVARARIPRRPWFASRRVTDGSGPLPSSCTWHRFRRTARSPAGRVAAAARRPITSTSRRDRSRRRRCRCRSCFRAGVDCGHTEARTELKRRVAVVDRSSRNTAPSATGRRATANTSPRSCCAAQRTLLTMQIQCGQRVEHHALDTRARARAHRRTRIVDDLADDGADSQCRPSREDRARPRTGALVRRSSRTAVRRPRTGRSCATRVPPRWLAGRAAKVERQARLQAGARRDVRPRGGHRTARLLRRQTRRASRSSFPSTASRCSPTPA